MRTRLMTVTITALSFAGALTLHAQAPQSPAAPPATPPQATQPATDTPRPMADTQAKASDATITVIGCIKSEADVPGLPGP